MVQAKTARGTGLVNIEPPVEDFIRALRQSPDRLDKQVRKAFRESSKRVRDDARKRARGIRHLGQGPADGAPARLRAQLAQHWSDLITSITSGATSDAPYAAVGSTRVPWALGWEFGSRHRQFPPWRGAGRDAGYFFWPAIREAAPRVEREMVDAINDAFREAFPGA
jgi:hypothetical protein